MMRVATAWSRRGQIHLDLTASIMVLAKELTVNKLRAIPAPL
jgi:hypothetical protein